MSDTLMVSDSSCTLTAGAPDGLPDVDGVGAVADAANRAPCVPAGEIDGLGDTGAAGEGAWFTGSGRRDKAPIRALCGWD